MRSAGRAVRWRRTRGAPSVNCGDASSCIVTAPAPAASSGRKSRSQSAPSWNMVPTRPVNTSAAATGVPNRAPMVPAAVITTMSCGETRGQSAWKSATRMPALIPMIAASGPRLTPPPRASTATIVSEGTARSGSGGAIRWIVAESWPPWPGMSHTTRPTRSPMALSTPKIHQREVGSTPRAAGRLDHRPCSSAWASASTA